MAIDPGSTGRADDFIFQADKDVTPANDEGRVPKLQDDARLHADFVLPPGVMFPFAGDGGDVPDGFFLCDGQAISRTTYAELFALIGTTYGAGNGTTTFNVPNVKGKVVVGLDSGQTEFDNLGETGGSKTHNHSYSGNVGGASSKANVDGYDGPGSGSEVADGSHVHAYSGNVSTESGMPPYLVTNYIIKY